MCAKHSRKALQTARRGRANNSGQSGRHIALGGAPALPLPGPCVARGITGFASRGKVNGFDGWQEKARGRHGGAKRACGLPRAGQSTVFALKWGITPFFRRCTGPGASAIMQPCPFRANILQTSKATEEEPCRTPMTATLPRMTWF